MANEHGHDAAATATRAGKYLTFALGKEEYGLEILKVREIIGLMEITMVPRTPEYVRGVINLRGQVIPVIDLRTKFGMPAVEASKATCIIVSEIRVRDQRVCMGVVVDRVSEVLNIAGESIGECPPFGGSVPTEFIHGIAKLNGSVKILIDIDRVLTGDEASAVGAVREAAAA